MGSLEPTLGKFEVEIFDGKGDFGMWKFKMRMALEIQGLEEVLEESETNQDLKQKPDSAWLKKDKRAKNLICVSLGNTVLKQKFASFKMDEHKSMEENVDVFLKLVDDLESR